MNVNNPSITDGLKYAYPSSGNFDKDTVVSMKHSGISDTNGKNKLLSTVTTVDNGRNHSLLPVDQNFNEISASGWNDKRDISNNNNGDGNDDDDDDDDDDDEEYDEQSCGNHLPERLCMKMILFNRYSKEYVKSKRMHVSVFVVLLSVCNALMYANKYAVASSLPHIRESFLIGNGALSLMIAVNCIFSIVTSHCVSHYIRVKYHLAFMTGSQMLCFIGSFGSAYSSHFSEFIIAQIVFASAEGCFVTCITPYIKQLGKPIGKDYHYTSYVYASISLGVSVGYIFGGVFSTHHSWRTIFYVQMLLFFILWWLVSLIPRNQKHMRFTSTPTDSMLFGDLSDLETNVNVSSLNNGAGITSTGYSSTFNDKLHEAKHQHRKKRKSIQSIYGDIKTKTKPLRTNKVFICMLIGEMSRVATVNSIGFWMPLYIYNTYGITLDRISLFLAIICLIIGGGGTVLVGYLFGYHHEHTKKLKAPESFPTYAFTKSGNAPNLPENFLDTEWKQYIKNYLAFDYVSVFLIVGLFSTIFLLVTHSYYTFCVLTIIEVFCIFSILTPINNLFVDIVPAEDKEISVSSQFVCSRVFSDMLIIPLIGFTKDFLPYGAFVFIVVLLLIIAIVYFYLARRCFTSNCPLPMIWAS